MTLVFDRLQQVNTTGTLGQGIDFIGQTFRAMGSDLSAVEVGLDVDGGVPDLNFKLRILDFDESGAQSVLKSVIFESPVQTSAADFDFDFDVVKVDVAGLSLVPGQLYAFVLDAEGPSAASLATSFVAPNGPFPGLGANLRGQEMMVGNAVLPGPGGTIPAGASIGFDNGSDLAFRLTYGRDGGDTLDFSGNAAGENAFVNLGSGEVFDGKGGQPSSAGRPHVHGGAGNDSLVGDAAINQLKGGDGIDVIFGGHWSGTPGSGGDLLDGEGGNDAIWGFDGVDIIRGGAGDDGLLGGSGNDNLEGGPGVDVLFGGDFIHTGFAPNSGIDNLSGGDGGDGLWGFDGDDIITGGRGDDYAEGGLGSDRIEGGEDNDTLLGQAGDDTLVGDQGFDYLYGGTGEDTFIFSPSNSFDVIWDFSAAERDAVWLSPFFGVSTFEEFRTHLGGFTFEGASYSTITFAFPQDDGTTRFAQLILKGIAFNAWTEDQVIL